MARRRPEPTANPARGAALVVVAVVIGLFLLRNGLDTSEAITTNGGPSQSSDDGGTSDGGDSTDDGTGETTTTLPAVRPPAEVPVVVLNGTTVGGVAKAYSDALATAGYQLPNPDGANADADTATTLVYFIPGFEAEAAAVATAIAAPATVVPAALPTPPPGQISGASVVVVIGTDLASTTPTTVTTTTTAAT